MARVDNLELKIKNAAPDGANIESGKETTLSTHAKDTVSAPNIITERSGVQVKSLLHKGEENAISTKALLRLTGFSTARVLQSVIMREREAGALILSTARNGGGYFLPDDGEKGKHEIAAFAQTLHARAINTIRILKSAKRALDIVEGQKTIEITGRGREECGEE